MTRITTNSIATATPPIPPAMGPKVLVFWGFSRDDCATTILPDKYDKDYYQHNSHCYTTNTSCYRTNISCLRLWWREVYYNNNLNRCSLSLLQKYITLIMSYIRNYDNFVTTNRHMQFILRRICQVRKVCSQSICVLAVSMLPFSTISIFDFVIEPTAR